MKIIARIQLVGLLAAPAFATFINGPQRSYQSYATGLFVLALLLIGTVVHRAPFPTSRPAALALAGISAFAALSVASVQWAGVKAPAIGEANRTLIYAAMLAAAIPAVRPRASARLVEPAFAVLAFSTSLWGLSERILPRTINLDNPFVALGRLSAPLGYWNAMGLVAGIGMVLAVAIAADTERAGWARVAATAALPTLAAALWMSYSRGALAATAAGLAGLVAFRSSRSQLAAVSIGFTSLVCAALTIEALPASRTTSGSLRNRSHDALPLGLELLAATLIAIALGVTLVRLSRAGRRLGSGRSRRMASVAAAATFLLALAPTASVLLGQTQSDTAQSGASAQRLASAESNRSDYWRVQLNRFADEPIFGNGSGSFQAAWIQRRDKLEMARNSHSLPIEVAGDLGLIGLIALISLFVGVGLACRSSVLSDRSLTAGPAAGLIAFGSHCLIDWDWQISGLMLMVVMLAAVPLGATDRNRATSARSRMNLPARRIAGIVVAVIGVAWFAWSLRSLQLENRAQAVADSAQLLGWTPDRWNRVERDLDQASHWSPDPSARIALAFAASRSNHPEEYLRIAQQVAEDNPESWLAWSLLSQAARTSDPELAAAASAESKRLRPTH